MSCLKQITALNLWQNKFLGKKKLRFFHTTKTNILELQSSSPSHLQANNQKSHLGLVCMVNSFSSAYLEWMYLVADSGLRQMSKGPLLYCPRSSSILNILGVGEKWWNLSVSDRALIIDGYLVPLSGS